MSSQTESNHSLNTILYWILLYIEQLIEMNVDFNLSRKEVFIFDIPPTAVVDRPLVLFVKLFCI